MRVLVVAAFSWCVLSPGTSSAQETFQYVGGAGLQAWETAANWTGGGGQHSEWPGQAPEAGTRDSADVVGAWAAGLELQIAGPVTLDVLRMGATGLGETLISGGGSLTANRIEPAGSVFATNRLAVDLLLDGGLELSNATTALVIDGRIINGGPTGAQRTIVNATDRLLHVNGDVLLSNGGAAGDLRFVNAGISETVVAGVITDGAVEGGRVTYAKGRFEILNANTYTGSTQLGANDPNVGSEHVIHTDTAFGLGRLIISGGNELKVVRAAEGKGTRTLANDVQIARDVVFAGAETIVLAGTVWQSNGRSVINRIGATGSLVIDGDVFASDSADVREWTFDDTGRTVVNGVIDDSLAVPTLSGATVTQRGTGTLVFTNPDVAAYTGRTRVDSHLQLGVGAAAVGLNGDVVTGDGVLEINHNATLPFDTLIEGGLQVVHTGGGVTTLTRSNNNTGGYVVEQGTLVVNGAAGDVAVSGVLAGNGAVGAIDAGPLGTVAPGDGLGVLSASSAVFDGSARLDIEVGPDGADRLDVAGSALAAGELAITLIGGPVGGLAPITVVQAGTLSGEFGNAAHGARLRTTDGAGSFVVAYDGGAVRLTDFGLAGDFNDDGVVDAADYTVWRDRQGEAASSLPNDVDGGLIGAAQYATWAGNYGAAIPAGDATTAAPEPAGAVLATLAAGLGAFRRPKRPIRR